MNIFVGNLSFDSTEGDVKKLFEDFGSVASIVIVMRKDKKATKSRGFGFVDMTDERQALAAIAALGGKEFMGRVLDVAPALPKVEVQSVVELKGNRQPGTYKGGRRTHSYMKRRQLAGIQEEVKPRQGSHENPMRWRKKQYKSRPWQKSAVEYKPWEKTAGGARPWKKAEGESKPWRKTEGGVKPWKKPAGDAKPWKKPAGDAKPWSKSSKRPQKFKFNGNKNPGDHKRRKSF